MPKYRSISIRMSEEEYEKYRAVKERENLTWKQMLKRGAEEKYKRKTVVVTLKYDSKRTSVSKGMFHPVSIDIQIIKVDTQAELEKFDKDIENTDFLKNIIREPLVNEFFAAHDEPEMSFDSFMSSAKSTAGVPEYETTTEPKTKEKVRVLKWRRF